MKDEVYIIILDGYESIGIDWIVLNVNNNNVTYFDSFRVEHIPPKNLKKFVGNKNFITNIFAEQAFNNAWIQ